MPLHRPVLCTMPASHGAAVWGSAQVALPALDIAPPAIFWAPEEIAIDVFHHTVYAIATGIAYELLSDRRETSGGGPDDRTALLTSTEGAAP
jgi:hypothetical protein